MNLHTTYTTSTKLTKNQMLSKVRKYFQWKMTKFHWSTHCWRKYLEENIWPKRFSYEVHWPEIEVLSNFSKYFHKFQYMEGRLVFHEVRLLEQQTFEWNYVNEIDWIFFRNLYDFTCMKSIRIAFLKQLFWVCSYMT